MMLSRVRWLGVPCPANPTRRADVAHALLCSRSGVCTAPQPGDTAPEHAHLMERDELAGRGGGASRRDSMRGKKCVTSIPRYRGV
eukprot:3159258-Pleurochrysis_carterae.AAC.1